LEAGKRNKEDTIKSIDETNDLIWKLRGVPIADKNYDPMKAGLDALEQSKELNYRYGLGRSYLNMGMGSFVILHDLDKSFAELIEALSIFNELQNKKWAANTRLTLAIINTSHGRSEQALYNALKGIEYYENCAEDDMDKTMAYYVIGTVYKDLKKYFEAENFYRKGIATKEVETTSWGGRIFTSIASIYTQQKKYDDAIKMSEKSLQLLRDQQNIIAESRALTDLGLIYRQLKDYDKALNYLFEGLKIRQEINLKQFALTSLIEISATYREIGENNKAINYLKLAANLASETNQHTRLAKIYREIAETYKSLNQFEQSLAYIELYLEITHRIADNEKESKIENLQNALLREKEEEIERLKNVELKNAYNLITEKNKEITDSIHYAKRIQKALLASDDLLRSQLNDYFVLYKPKDIVSGDFYWASTVVRSFETGVRSNDSLSNNELGTTNSQLFYLAVCDSTGHGVPGAFMSLLNTTFLNEAINEKKITEPNLIFNHVRNRLTSAISQDGARDGMDGILICLDKNRNKVTYSAANNAPVLIRENKLTTFPADKMPVGKDENDKSFTLHALDYIKGDTLYLFTDGYSDQFGGDKGKKFRYKQLEELLIEVHSLPLNDQKAVLEKKFEEWKGALEQVDDVLIIGIKF
jgi:serine phosphatase RsbU (regulator of sigma subunit)